jgi:hypothetical protein
LAYLSKKIIAAVRNDVSSFGFYLIKNQDVGWARPPTSYYYCLSIAMGEEYCHKGSEYHGCGGQVSAPDITI